MAEGKPRDGEQTSDGGSGDGGGGGGRSGSLCHSLTRCSAGEIDSSCSTPYESAPSSPSRGGAAAGGYFHSAPASPMHFILLSSSSHSCVSATDDTPLRGGAAAGDGFEFEFSARFSSAGAGNPSVGSMISADELFLNGQIRPMNLSSHLQRPQALSPLLDLEADEDEEEQPAVRGRDIKMRSGSMRRRARSASPLRTLWDDGEEDGERSTARRSEEKEQDPDLDADLDVRAAAAAAMPASASSSRSSSTSSSRHSKRWVFLKDLLYRSKSEGRGNAKDKFWNAISFSPSKEKSSSFRDKFKESLKPSPRNVNPPSSSISADAAHPTAELQKGKQKTAAPASASASKRPASSSSSKPMNAVGKRRGSSQSAHERHYTANRAQAEEMRKKTFLPYRQGLLGCLWFSSRSYGAMNGFARALNPVSSR